MVKMYIRHIPIVDKRHQSLGILSHRDILRADLSCLTDSDENSRSNVKVTSLKSIMSEKVCSASPKDSLCSVGLILQREKFGCVPIVEDDILVGDSYRYRFYFRGN
jgi:CBS domain-containing membrane protein|tara:strand:+ start:842 stop:1159 length:318 start_codon:yes stop_codon:yes gene_type:complete